VVSLYNTAQIDVLTRASLLAHEQLRLAQPAQGDSSPD
jgi:hypothetical protein